MTATTTRPTAPVRHPTGPRSRRWWRSGLTAYGYLSPTLLVMLVMMAVPVVMVFAYSTLSNVIIARDTEFAGSGQLRHAAG